MNDLVPVLGPDRPACAGNGPVTGLPSPEASHLLLPEAFAAPDVITRTHAAALEKRSPSREFGDPSLPIR